MVFSMNQLTKMEENTVLLPELNLTVPQGEVIAVQSENEYIERLFDLFNHPRDIKEGMITLPEGGFQNIYLFQQDDGLYKRLTVLQMLRFWCRLYRQQTDLDKILNICELHACVSKKTKQLTLSEQYRLQFALAFIQPAEVYIWKDPSMILDLQTKQVLHDVIRLLADEGGAVLILTPTLEEAIRLGNVVYRYSSRGVKLVEQEDAETETGTEGRNGEEAEVTSMQVKLDKISAKMEDKIILFNPLEIDYVEAREGQTFLFVNKEEFASSETIKALEERLLPFGFFRCHRSYLVNLQRVREIIIWSKNSYSLSLDNPSKSTIPLSKANYSKLKELMHL
ncbi:LytTR family transcriptional regulator DNA-binding domain-containing protein [Oceanobacillus locisalsi]|uniref:LytTR family transcriptional regulator DNA-binding domain-containing protein n=1 Tax=Oceanobacillus locisalsi TaxID=546107 RepID=A0ABW3NKR9_9BACI